jgi:hypothetical protein
MNDFFSQHSMFGKVMASFIIVVFMGLAYIFLFVPVLFENIKGLTRLLLGIGLTLYSAYRIYRLIVISKEKNDEE